MLSKRLQRFISKVAIFAIVFASLAPTISHAFAKQNINSFSQEICSSSGQKLFIQVITTKGQEHITALDIQSPSDQTSKNINHHLDHCPFCSNPITHTVIIPPQAPIIAKLAEEAQIVAEISPVTLPSFSVLPPPSQAPPAL
jgi:hypothetical protein